MTLRRKQQIVLLLADLLSSEAVWLCFLIFRWLVYQGRLFNAEQVLIPAFSFVLPLIVYPLGCLVIYYLSGYYLRMEKNRFSMVLIPTFTSSLIISLVSFFIIVIDDVTPIDQYQYYLVSLGVLFALQFFISLLPRIIIYLVRKRYKTLPRIFTMTSLEQMDLFMKEHNQSPFDAVIIDFKNNDENDIYLAIQQLYPTNVEILIVPRTYDMLTGSARITTIQDAPYICISALKMTDAELCIKRASDVVISGLGLVLLSPLYLFLSIGVKASSPGPVLYKQERIGLHGLPFRILKFRTMVQNAEQEHPQLTKDEDPRITPIGRWLRKYRLDELPQLWNVFKGEMALVGPRPERAYFIDQIQERAPYYCLLYGIRPGLTSWGPIKVGYTDTIEKMIARLNYDIVYMENMSIRLDIKILFYTIGVLVDGKGK